MHIYNSSVTSTNTHEPTYAPYCQLVYTRLHWCMSVRNVLQAKGDTAMYPTLFLESQIFVDLTMFGYCFIALLFCSVIGHIYRLI
jgi:hypothetical protein